MTALHDVDELTCPRCGATLEGDFGQVPVDVDDNQIRTALDCPACDAPLALGVESAAPEALGVDVWVEDRRDDTDDE